MFKRIILFAYLFLFCSFVYATVLTPDQKAVLENQQQVEPHKERKVVKQEEKPEENTGNADVLAKEVREVIEQQSIPVSDDKGDVQSFNFLYYLLQHFKFSDFISE